MDKPVERGAGRSSLRSEPIVVVSTRDGRVVGRSRAARAILGRSSAGLGVNGKEEAGSPSAETHHRHCWSLMRATPGARDLPCREGCSEARSDGSGPVEAHDVRLHDRPFELRCEPVGDRIVSLLQPGTPPALDPDPNERLTPREIEVLELLAEGLDGGAIAKALGISPGTVRTHVEHMRVSLGCRTRAGLVSKGYRLGYLSA